MCIKAVMPVLRRVNYTETVGHIFSGLTTGMSMPPSSEGVLVKKKKKKRLRKALHLSAYEPFEELRLQNRCLRDRLHRDYLYVTASKYLTAADYRGVLLGPPVISGLLWKRAQKPLFGSAISRLVRKPPLRETSWRVEWCELRVTAGRLLFFYTKTDAACGFVGSTKKAPVRWIKLDREKMRIVIRLPLGREDRQQNSKKFLQFRVLSTEEASRHHNATETLEDWWAAISNLASLSTKPDAHGFYDMGQTTLGAIGNIEPHDLPLSSLLFEPKHKVAAPVSPREPLTPSARYLDVDLIETHARS
jgi:hypothetical protein